MMAGQSPLSPNMPSYKNKKNSLTIRLAESAVFLRADQSYTLRNNGSASNAFSCNGMLRGLLVLDLVKPTKITSIEVELTALTTTSCPEGVPLPPHTTAECSTPKCLRNRRPSRGGHGATPSLSCIDHLLLCLESEEPFFFY